MEYSLPCCFREFWHKSSTQNSALRHLSKICNRVICNWVIENLLFHQFSISRLPDYSISNLPATMHGKNPLLQLRFPCGTVIFQTSPLSAWNSERRTF